MQDNGPQRCPHPNSPNLRVCYLYGGRDFADVMKVRMLGWRADPRVLVRTGSLFGERGRLEGQSAAARRTQASASGLKTEEGTRAGNVGASPSWKRRGDGLFPRAARRNPAPQSLRFIPGRPVWSSGPQSCKVATLYCPKPSFVLLCNSGNRKLM